MEPLEHRAHSARQVRMDFLVHWVFLAIQASLEQRVFPVFKDHQEFQVLLEPLELQE